MSTELTAPLQAPHRPRAHRRTTSYLLADAGMGLVAAAVLHSGSALLHGPVGPGWPATAAVLFPAAGMWARRRRASRPAVVRRSAPAVPLQRVSSPEVRSRVASVTQA